MKATRIAPDSEKMAEYRASSRKVEVRQRRKTAKDITRAAHGLELGFRADRVDLAPQPADMDIDQVGARVEVIAPDRFEDHRARQGLAGVLHHELEHLEFGRQQRERLAVARRRAADEIEFERTDLEHGRARSG